MDTKQGQGQGQGHTEPKVQATNHGEICQDSLDKDIYKTEAHLHQLNEFKELREAARTLSEYIKNHFNPHTTAIVTGIDVKLVQDLKRVNF